MLILFPAADRESDGDVGIIPVLVVALPPPEVQAGGFVAPFAQGTGSLGTTGSVVVPTTAHVLVTVDQALHTGPGHVDVRACEIDPVCPLGHETV